MQHQPVRPQHRIGRRGALARDSQQPLITKLHLHLYPPRQLRFFLCLCLLLTAGLLTPAPASADTDHTPLSPKPVAPPQPSPSQASAHAASEGSLWLWTGTLRSDAGYRDNLLYARDAREKSAAYGGSAEITATRIPTSRWRWQNLASLEGYWFPTGKTVDREILAFAHSELRYDFNAAWAATLEGQYAFQDFVFDATLTETNQNSLPVQAHPVHLNPGVRWELNSGWWFHLKANLERMNFRQSQIDGYYQFGPVIELGKSWAQGSQLRFKTEFLNREYDHRDTYSLLGFPDGRDSLRYSIVGTEMAWTENLDRTGRWQNNLRVGFQNTMDNGSGYFDYQRYSFTEGLTFRAARWEIQGRGGVRHYHYDFQPGDRAGTHRYRTTLVAAAQIRYLFTKHLFLHARYDWEENRTNLKLDRYRLSTVSSGIGWEF